MASRSRLIARLIDADGDVVADALDNVEIADSIDEVVQINATSNSSGSFLVDSVSVSEIRAVTFQVTAFSSTDYQFTTISAVLNNINNDCEYNEFGTMESSELSTYEVQVDGDKLKLIANPISSGIEFNVSRISVDR
jgi:hypothetical protein